MDLWLDGAERLHPCSRHVGGLGMLRNNDRRAAIWHRTVGNDFAGNVDVLVREEFECHLLWDPWSGELGQFFAADRGSYAMRHVGDPATNTYGRVCFQIEVVDHGRDTKITDTPMKNGDKVMRFLRQLDVPDVMPAGPMLPKGQHKNATLAQWAKSGHFGHCHAPSGNDHSDPFEMDAKKLFALGKPLPKPKPKPTPTPKENDMRRLVKAPNDPRVFITDDIHRRHIEDPAERDDLIPIYGPVQTIQQRYLERIVDVTHPGK